MATIAGESGAWEDLPDPDDFKRSQSVVRSPSTWIGAPIQFLPHRLLLHFTLDVSALQRCNTLGCGFGVPLAHGGICSKLGETSEAHSTARVN